MLYRNLIILLFFFAKVHSYQGCSSNPNKVILPCKEYDLNRPSKLALGDALTEISGISFYAKDTSVFAISDDDGYLYKIHITKNFLTEKWRYDRKHDFEDVVQHDSSFYILESNGNVQSLNFTSNGDTIFKRRNKFLTNSKNDNEFESIYYDDQLQKLVLICKDCHGDKKKSVSAWELNPQSNSYSPASFSINTEAIAKKIGDKDLKFKPSAAAVNPLTNDLWILSAIDQLLVVTDRKGVTKDVYTLNPVIFSQPEGITFTPWGDLLISNEAPDRYGTANLMFFKLKKKS